MIDMTVWHQDARRLVLSLLTIPLLFPFLFMLYVISVKVASAESRLESCRTPGGGACLR